ncbi:MAG TPA: type I polyketide synthase, partial [Candidatus Dormibacteraeota bacterium]|nr:type I polyketide synthase [Candidatus Dormibacteraeota bacterium]
MADLQERLARLPADRQRLLLARLAGEAAERGLGHRPLAIVGMAARVPGARDLAGFWDLLEAGRDAITEVPAGRWSVQGAPAQTRWGGFLDDVDAFDAEFFGISPREADGMDPQQRILLETAWTALEDAGIDPRSLAGSETGVFVGISNSEYAWRMVGRPELIDTHSAPGNAHSVAANRLSYLLDLRGPSVAVDTACSSSLVALHQAARSLAVGEAELAIVGGVNVILSPDTSISYARAGGLASDGRCKAFADGADGMVRSEGCGVLVLKDLDAARRAGDRVYAVLLGSAVNNDGRTNGLTAPSPAAQQAVVERALRSAGVPPADVQYVEAHGTGTALGDAIEAHALGASVGPTAARRARCAVGSVKSNIGHTESAAGVLAIVKTALAIRHRRLPPTLHVTRPNPRIPFEALGLAVRIEDGPWPEPDRRLVAGVSAFGFGGTNAHAVLAEPPAAAEPARPGGPALLTMSAAGPDELRALAAEYDELLARRPDDVAAVCAAAALRRAHEPHRLSAAAAKPEGLRERLAAFLAGRPAPGLSVTAGPTGAGVAFVYAGMGQRRPRSGDELRESEPAFRAAFDECETVFEELLGGPLPAAPDDLVGRQAWHFAAQVAQTALWRSWGIRPEAVCGHSVGEVAAAHCAGALTLADACLVVVARARQLAAGPEGRMLAAELEPAEVEETLAAFPDVEIAAENAPGAVVLAGSAEDIAAVTRRWEGARFLRLIDGQVVSHCGRVRPQAARLAAELSGLRPTAGDVPFVSAVTGGELAGTALDAEYWAANLSRPVRFEAAVRALLERGACTFLELSAVPALAPAVVQTAAAAGVRVTAVPAPRGGTAEREQLWQALGRLYVQGVLPDFRALYGPWTPHRELP